MSSNKVQRQGRRVIPAVRTTKAGNVAKATMSLGDLIAAAFDALGESTDVTRVLQSREMTRAIGRRIVVA